MDYAVGQFWRVKPKKGSLDYVIKIKEIRDVNNIVCQWMDNKEYVFMDTKRLEKDFRKIGKAEYIKWHLKNG